MPTRNLSRLSLVIVFVALATLIVSANSAQAGKFNRVLSVGDEAPRWKQLPGVDGKTHSLDDFRDAKVTVIVFLSNHCPVARSYEPMLIAMQHAYAEKKVSFVAINVSRFKHDLLPAMIERAKATGLNFPYLHDDSQSTGRQYGAGVTPQVIVLGAQRKIAYLGAIDDGEGKVDQAMKHHLRDALDAVLAGKSPEVSETRPVGCGIIYE